MLKPGMTVEIKRGTFAGSPAEITEVIGSRARANFEVFGTTQTQDFSYADFGLEYVPEIRPLNTLLEEFDGLYRAAAPKRYELLQEGLGPNAGTLCAKIPGVENTPEELVQLYQWKNGMTHLEDGWISEFGEDAWWETTVLDNVYHFNSLDQATGEIEMWEEIAEKKKAANEPCYWRKGFFPLLEAPFWGLVVVDTLGLFGGKPHQIISFDFKCTNGFTIVHENLNMWLTTLIQRLKAGLIFEEWSLETGRIEQGLNEYYTRRFPKEIPLQQES